MIVRMLKNKKGQGFTEYALLVAGVALVGAIGVVVLGEKTNEIISSVAATLPGANGVNNRAIQAGALIEYHADADGNLELDFDTITDNNDGTNPRLTDNINEFQGVADSLEDNIIEVYPN